MHNECSPGALMDVSIASLAQSRSTRLLPGSCQPFSNNVARHSAPSIASTCYQPVRHLDRAQILMVADQGV